MSDSTTTPISQTAGFSRDERELRAARFAMRMSLAVGVVMLAGKSIAYYVTGSAAILSDFAESVVHVIAVAFAVFSLRLSSKPAAPTFLYGYEPIAFFSAGFEGAVIVVAAIWISSRRSRNGSRDCRSSTWARAHCCSSAQDC